MPVQKKCPSPDLGDHRRECSTAVKAVLTNRIATLRAKGLGWKRIAAEMGVGVGTIYRVVLEGSKTRKKVF